MVAEVKQLPANGLGDVAAGLRRMADRVEAGQYADSKLAWVLQTDGEIQVGIIGRCAEPMTATHLLLARGMRNIEG